MLRRASWAIAVVVASTIGGVAAVWIVAMLDGCTPAEGQNRTVEATQAAGLAGCITEAKTMDASHDERFAAYTICANLVDADAGRKP